MAVVMELVTESTEFSHNFQKSLEKTSLFFGMIRTEFRKDLSQKSDNRKVVNLHE